LPAPALAGVGDAEPTAAGGGQPAMAKEDAATMAATATKTNFCIE
jgi:hypothetical protein